MRVQVISGAPAQSVAPPCGGTPVPEGLIEVLKTAARFAGKHHRKLADGQFVHVLGGKAYASNNRHIVEVDLGHFPSLRMAKRDVALLARIGGDPSTVNMTEGKAEFVWPDGQWVRLNAESASEEFVQSCKQRFEKYWNNPQGMPIAPKAVDLLVERAKKGEVVSVAVIGHRVIGTDNGFFFPAEKKATTSTLIRDRKLDPHRDDLFAEALKDTKDAQAGKDARIERLKKRLLSIQDDIIALEADNAELEQKLVRQHHAIDAYQSGDPLSDEQRDLLTPQCRDLVADESKTALQNEFKRHKGSIPDGWEVTGKRQDDDYIYVTIRRERVTNSKPVETAAAKVKKALAQFFNPGFDRDFRVRWDQLGTLSPIVRGAP